MLALATGLQVYDLGMCCADFSILGESVTSLVQRGFNKGHAQHMKEPPYNYTHALSATTEDVRFLFGHTEVAVAASDNSRRNVPVGHSQLTTHRAALPSHMSSVSEQGYLQLNSTSKRQTPMTNLGGTSKFKF